MKEIKTLIKKTLRVYTGITCKHLFILRFQVFLRACLYDPGQAGRDAYRDPARNTNSKECLYDPATYPA